MAETQLYAKVLSIDTWPAGSALEADAAAGATTLLVSDVTDFPADGGTLKIGDLVFEFTSIEDTDTPTINLTDPLPDDVVETTQVLVEPYAETKTALVDLGDEGDGLQITVPHALSALLTDGQREPDDAETVTLAEASPGRWRMVDVIGRRAELTADAGENLPPDDPSDGLPPTNSPDPTAIGGIGAVFLRWTAIENADPVTYQVHVSPDPGAVLDGTTLATETPASSVTLRALPDGSPLAYDTIYYFWLIATDMDGAASPSAPVSAQLFKVTGPDIAADYVYAGNVVADQIIGGTINTDLLIAGTMKTALAGSRVEWGAFGLVVYDSTGTPTTVLGSNAISTFKGQVQASTLSVTNGMSIQGTANEIAQAGSLTLAAGVSAAANAPTVVNDYETMAGWKQSNGDPWPAGYEFKTMQRVGTKWVVGARRTSDDLFFVRTFNDDGSFDAYYGTGWAGQQIQRGAWISSTYPAYGFRNTDRRLVAATHSTSGGTVTNTLSWDFASNTQPAGTTEVGTVSYSSGSVKIDATSGVPDSSLEQTGTTDMRGRRLTVKVVPSGSVSAAGQVVEVRMRNATAGEYILARVEGETGLTKIKFQTYNGSPGSTKTVVATVFAGYSYWRLTESNGDAKLQVSTDGSSWSTIATITDHGLTDADLASMSIGLIVRAGDGGEATSSRFDDVTLGAGFVDYGDVIPWVDATNPPALGTDGTYLLAGERTSDNRIKIYEIDPHSSGRVVTTYTSGISTDFAFVTPLATVAKGSFDFGSTRFIVTTGNSGDQWAAVFTVSGTTLTYQRNESFYIPGQAGGGYDGTQFQTLGTDGIRRKHTAVTWTDVSDWAKTWYAATTWYDGDATGGTHETTPSPRAAFAFRKRSRYTITSGTIPDLGGTDDPDRIRVYLASSSVATLYRQATTAAGINSAVFTTATFSGTAAPVSNDFPGAIAARIINAGSSLVVSGDGTIKGTTIEATTELKSPLITSTGPVSGTAATFSSLSVSGRLTPVYVIGPTSDYSTTAAQADVPQMTSTVTVAGTSDVYKVIVDLSVGASGTSNFTAYLVVNAVTQGPVIRYVTSAASGNRVQQSRTYIVTGLAAGPRIFKVQALSVTAGHHTLYSTQCTMTITQEK